MFQPVENTILNIALMILSVLVSVVFLAVLHNVPPN